MSYLQENLPKCQSKLKAHMIHLFHNLAVVSSIELDWRLIEETNGLYNLSKHHVMDELDIAPHDSLHYWLILRML